MPEVERQLRRRVAFDMLVAGISTRFINLSSSDFDRGVNEALEEIGLFANADRGYVFLLHDNGETIDNTNEWCAEGITPVIDMLQGLPADSAPWAMQQLLDGKVIPIESVVKLPPEASAEQKTFAEQEIQALILVPMQADGRTIGFLGFDSVRAERVWTEDDELLLRMVGEVFTNALQRKRTQHELRYRVAFDMLVASISTRFINLPSSDFDRGVNEALEEIGLFANVDRGYVFLLRDDLETVDNTHEWCAEGIDPAIEMMQGLPKSAFPFFQGQLEEGQAVSVDSVRNMPAEAAIERDLMAAQDVQALVVVPMRYEEQTIGFAGFDSVRTERRWTEDEVALLRIVGEVFTNALQRRRVEQALCESEERFRAVFETAEDSIFIKDVDLRYLWVNPSMERLFERPATDLIGRRDGELFGEEAGEHIEEVDRRTLAGETVEEVHSKPVGDEIKTFHVIKVPMRDDNGAITGLCGIARDVTEQHRLEQALRETEARILAIAENLPGVVYSYTAHADGTPTLHYISLGLEKLVGGGTVEWLDGNVNRFFELIHPMDRERLRQARVESIESGRPFDVEYRLRRDDGEYHWVHSIAQPERLEGGDSLWHGLLLDIEKRKLAEGKLKEYSATLESINQTLAEAKMQAEAATRSKSEFLANISHEIRTPLTAILGFAGILSEQLEKSANQETLGIIRRNSEHLLRILDDLLDLSKIEAGKLDLSLLDIRPDEVIEEIRRLMQIRAEEKGLRLELDYEDGIPELVRTDPVRMRQILFNLVANAIKFTEKGEVRIQARPSTTAGGEDALRIDIVDTGIGMSAEQIERLFRPFSQADSSSTRNYGGVGLGLSISHRLTTMLGGEIVVESEPGAGSRFSVILPTGNLDGVRRVIASERQAADVPVADSERRELAVERLQGRILMAEDNLTNRVLVEHILNQAGAEVVPTCHGEEAIAAARGARDEGRPFDAILMDVQMPVLDGIEATRRLREEGFEMPIIALTAYAMEDDRERCIAAGYDDHITKPIDREKLIGKINEWLAARPRH